MKELIIAALEKSISSLNIDYHDQLEITRPKQKENGDYSCNIALRLASIVHDNPMLIAEKLVANFFTLSQHSSFLQY